jgi:acyl-coenzyme A synthetase/AMP-(fatty) acid ligase
MIPGSQRALLAADRAIGAGNFLHRLLTYERDLDGPILSLDHDWTDAEGAVHRSLSLRDLKHVADAFASRCHALGVRPRDPVGVYVERPMDVLASHLALTGLGAIPVLVHGRLAPALAADYLRRVGVVGLLTDRAHLDAARALPEAGRDLPFITAIADLAMVSGASLPTRYPYAHQDDDPVLVTHSSGTTGVPKPVLMQHQSYFYGVRYRLRLPTPQGMDRRMLSALPPQHAAAIMTIMMALAHGVPIRLVSSQSADAVLDEIERFKPGMVSAFASTFADMTERDLGKRDLSSVSLWWSTGDAAHESHINRLALAGSHHQVEGGVRQLVPGSTVIDSLGSTEMGFMHFAKVHRAGTAVPERCLGAPLSFVDAAVLSEDGQALGPYHVGRLGVRSPCVTSGYWNDSVQTWRSRVGGYWLTGDLVYRDDGGQFYHLDRVTDAIETETGTLYSVLAEEILLRAHPEIADCTIVGVAGEGGRVEVSAFVSMRTGEIVDEEVLRRRANVALEQHEVPVLAGVVQVRSGDIPLGVTGKVRKSMLRERLQATGAAGRSDET